MPDVKRDERKRVVNGTSSRSVLDPLVRERERNLHWNQWISSPPAHYAHY
jgi:hypothetical protein